MKKILFAAFWLMLIIIPAATLLKVTPIAMIAGSSLKLVNFIQRGVGLFALGLIFYQIVLGAFFDKIAKLVGNWVFKFHIANGIFAYLLAFLHPILYLLTIKISGHGFDPYVAFVNVCLLCKTPYDYYLTLGRIGFWLLTVGIFAGIFRKYNSWFVKNWRNFHLVNYLVFFAIAIHGFFIGTDFRFQPFFALAIIETVIVLGILIFIEIPKWFRKFRVWVNS